MIRDGRRYLHAWKEQIDIQKQAGAAMEKTEAFYSLCKKRADELDPSGSSWPSYLAAEVLPQALGTISSLGIIGGLMYASSKFNHLVLNTISSTTWMGPNVAFAAMANMTAFGLYRSIRSKNLIGTTICAWMLYVQTTQFLQKPTGSTSLV
jgi:hypothetical protein